MGVTPVPWSLPMGPRDPEQEHRTATPLELFFDLVFVVAVAAAAAELHHGLVEGHAWAVLQFAMVFFAVWWAWMGYTWFASAYDTGDVVFRLLSFVIMAGSLMLAAGVKDLFDDGQSVLVVVGYCVMRLALVALWLRAARGHEEGRRTALLYAGGITAVQAVWVARLALDEESLLIPTFFFCVGLELTVPWFAERHRPTPFHSEHIAERYGLFTIIVLGEVVLSSVTAVRGAMDSEYAADLVPLVAGGLLIVFSLWWLYFKRDHSTLFGSGRVSLVLAAGYGHLLVFAAVAATGAGLAAAVDVVTHHAHTTPSFVAWTVAVPIATYAATLAGIHALDLPTLGTVAPGLVTAAALLLVAALGTALSLPIGATVLLLGLVCSAAVAQHVLSG